MLAFRFPCSPKIRRTSPIFFCQKVLSILAGDLPNYFAIFTSDRRNWKFSSNTTMTEIHSGEVYWAHRKSASHFPQRFSQKRRKLFDFLTLIVNDFQTGLFHCIYHSNSWKHNLVFLRKRNKQTSSYLLILFPPFGPS